MVDYDFAVIIDPNHEAAGSKELGDSGSANLVMPFRQPTVFWTVGGQAKYEALILLA